jgi:hypothetical protein
MVQDNVTRLIWELKTDDGTIHDKDNKFTWYDSNSDTNGGFPGTPSEGTDTEDFINEINAEKFGGKANWRMPKAVELFSIKNFGEEPIHNMFFPNSMEPFFWYWSSDTYTENKAWAWHMDFNYGRIVHHNEKSSLRQVWAVYGKHTNVIDQFITNPEGTITDISTGLMWERKTDDEGPNDKDNFYTWAEALAWVSKLNIDGYLGYTDWRLPTIKELHSIVDPNRYRPSINTDIFPNTQPTSYWSSTTDIVYPNNSCAMSFWFGGNDSSPKKNYYFVRAVRGGQNQLPNHLNISIPRQSDLWKSFSLMPIKWDKLSIEGNVTISISYDGGKSYQDIVDTTPNTGEYRFEIIDKNSPNCMLKITPLEDPSKETIQGLFSIFPYGDIDKNFFVNISDALLSLKILSSMDIDFPSSENIDNINKVSFPEVIYILEKCAGMR